jgi:hypothetical protein
MDASGVALKGPSKSPSPDWRQLIVLSTIVATSLLFAACASPDPTAVFGATFSETPRGYAAAPGQVHTASTHLTGASAGNVERPQSASAAKYPSCEKPEKCIDRLRALVGGSDRRWLKQPEETAAFANGVRMFAYMALQKKLTCDELAAALLETENAEKAFRGAVPGVRPMQVVAARRLSVRIARDLRAETAARCQRLSSAGRSS